MEKILVVNSNGSKWAGQKPDNIETLLEVLQHETLDPTFEQYGNFVNDYKPLKLTDENKHLLNCKSFFGNFLGYSHVFNIVTNDQDIIEKLTAAIRNNQTKEEYKQARAGHLAQEKVKKIARERFESNKLGLKELYQFPITDEGKMLFEQFKHEFATV